MRNLRLQDYDEYKYSSKELVMYSFHGIFIAAAFAYVFYRSWIAFFMLMPIVPMYLIKKKNSCVLKRKERLSIQFKEMMISLVTNLEAGYSVENSIANANKDMLMLFGKEGMITKELSYMTRCIRNNQTVEDLLDDFGKRSHVSDIKDFAEVFRTAKRSGGDITGMIKSTVDIIAGKMDVRRKINTLISAKKFEQSIMNVVPFGIILYIDLTSRGFFGALYHNVIGIIIMTAMLAVYLIAVFMAGKILEIKI